jgi:hypothetical protein
LEAASAEAAKHATLKSRVETEVDNRVKHWARGKSIRQMLLSLHVVMTTRSALSDFGASASNTAEELKKAYFKAIRLVHPDKVAPSASLEAQIESQKVFAALSEAYKRYTDSEGTSSSGVSGFASAAAQNAAGRRPATASAAGEVPNFGGFGAGASGASGAAARARAAFNAMHSATRGVPPPANTGTAAAAGVRFATFGAAGPPGGYTGASTSWGSGVAPSAQGYSGSFSGR